VHGDIETYCVAKHRCTERPRQRRVHLREIELDEAGDSPRALVVDQLKGMQRTERLASRQDSPRDSEEIGCCLPALLDNLHGPNRKDGGPGALSQNDDLHVDS
jgi:hypothetical protein